jgi:hypothetical protein
VPQEAPRYVQEPFGVPDGALASEEDLEQDFIKFPDHFGGIGRPHSDARVRVIAGRLGAGKSLYLRRMQLAQLANNSVFAERPARNIQDLSSEDVVRFTEMITTATENTETWKRLWRAAVFRSAASYLLTEDLYTDRLGSDGLERLRRYSGLVGSPDGKRRITHEARVIIHKFRDRAGLHRYLYDESWADAEHQILECFGRTRPLFLYVDAIDDNFKYAPRHWMRCQRGLFYAIMDLIRESGEGTRLHVVIALRDIALASTRASEAGTRYLEETHVNALHWDYQAIQELLRQKVERLPDRYFTDPSSKSVASWIGLRTIPNRRAQRFEENIESYLIRHTRLVPRDIVILGNMLCKLLLRIRKTGDNVDLNELIRDEVGRASRLFVQNQLAQVANQVWIDAMPVGAAKHHYESVYTQPNVYQIDSAVDQVMASMSVTRSEVFGRDALLEMNATMSDQLGTQISLGDILWQNQLLGFVEDRPNRGTVGRYYSIGDFARTTLPPSVSTYVWNPIVFDLVPGIDPVLEKPLTPTR